MAGVKLEEEDGGDGLNVLRNLFARSDTLARVTFAFGCNQDSWRNFLQRFKQTYPFTEAAAPWKE
jgi:hypothetical protein